MKDLPCTVMNAYTLLLNIDNLPAGQDYLNTIAILSVTNPTTVSSTGTFSLRVLKGTVNEYDYEYAFGQIGFTSAPAAMGITTISVTSNDGPNLFATYQLGVTFATGNIPSNGTVRIKVPSTLKIDTSKVTVIASPSLGTSVTTAFYRNYIILRGLTQQTLSTLALTIANLQNPSYSGNAGNFIVELRSNGTEQVIETGTVGPAMVSVARIPAQNIILTNFDIDVASMVLFSGDTVNYEISAKILNTLPNDCAVVIEVPSTITVSKCWGMDNFIDLSITQPVTCTVAGNMLKLTNLKGIYKFKSVKIGMRATNPVVTTDTPTGDFNVFTYSDRTMLKMVDQTNLPVSVTIKGTADTASAVTVPTTPLPSYTVLSSMDIQFTAGASFAALKVKIMLAPGFTNTNTGTNLVTCAVQKNGVAFIPAGSCSALINDKNFLEINMVTTPSLGSATATDVYVMTITPIASKGIQTPLYAGEYYAQVILSEGSTPTIYGTGHFNVMEMSFTPSLLAVVPYTYDYAHLAVYDFSVYLPFAIEQGQWVPKDEIGITYFEIRFSGSSFSSVLGTNTPNSAIPCYGIVGLYKYQNQKGSQ